jgi:hypothetical protein
VTIVRLKGWLRRAEEPVRPGQREITGPAEIEAIPASQVWYWPPGYTPSDADFERQRRMAARDGIGPREDAPPPWQRQRQRRGSVFSERPRRRGMGLGL